MAEEYPEIWLHLLAQYKDVLNKEVFDLPFRTQRSQSWWKGVPIGSDGKVRLRDGRTGEYF